MNAFACPELNAEYTCSTFPTNASMGETLRIEVMNLGSESIVSFAAYTESSSGNDFIGVTNGLWQSPGDGSADIRTACDGDTIIISTDNSARNALQIKPAGENRVMMLQLEGSTVVGTSLCQIKE